MTAPRIKAIPNPHIQGEQAFRAACEAYSATLELDFLLRNGRFPEGITKEATRLVRAIEDYQKAHNEALAKMCEVKDG